MNWERNSHLQGIGKMEPLQSLDWDTKFFGFQIARINNPHASADELRQARLQMLERKIPLAYWAADEPTGRVQEIAVELGGTLVDQKLTFAAAVQDLPQPDLPALELVESYQPEMPMADLKKLAVDSGIYSRFVVDPKFPKEKAIAMFEEWIVRSANKAIADDVLVIRQNGRIAGMSTVARKGDVGSIGLVAVSEKFRGRQFGEALVRAAQNWSRQLELKEIQVTTQHANLPARRLYEKCNFHLKKMEYFYHFWC